MKRLRISLSLVVLAALILLVPVGAQSPVRRAMDLDDILGFRAVGVTTLSPNGQWLAYRMSPLQGDSEVIVRSTPPDKEFKFAVGEGAAARRRSRTIRCGR